MKKLQIALHGMNGHQIYSLLQDHPRAELVATSCIDAEKTKMFPQVRRYDTLAELLASGGVDLICLCSPIRAEQAADAIQCLQAGVAVYAEKPAALTEEALEEILAVSAKTGVEFHEIADTAFFEPYHTFGKLVKAGKVGDVVQVYAQKSYPTYHPNRPGDENTDGGILRQVGIHAVRMMEHTAGVRLTEISAVETKRGNRNVGELHMAVSLTGKCEGGAIATACINYCNPLSFGQWGNETLRVFGTHGMMEITDGGRHTHIYTDSGDEGEIDLSHSDCVHFFDLLVNHLLDGAPMPLTLEEELHPVRVVLRAKALAEECC